jgi:glycosyltransferase involved in cell wall biosynthesis
VIDTPPRRPLLVFSDDWGRHPSSCPHLVRQLLGHYQVTWVNTIGTRPPRLNLATLARGAEKLRHWFRPAPAGPDGPGPDRVLNPRMWPWFRPHLARRLNAALLARQLTPALAALPGTAAVTTVPIVADLVGRLPVRHWVYYCVDDFSLWPGLDQRTLGRMEADLVAKADVLVAVSETLRDRLARMGRDAHLLTHGVDLDFWANAGPGPVPELDGLERPLVVFWGVVDRRMDVELVRRVAAELPSGTVVLVGPEADPDPALAALPRVVRVPPVPYADLPRIAREAAVLIMPYADLPVTRAIQPLKMKEYLATGRPVVVRDLPATRPWADCLDLAGGAAAFAAAVRRRLAEGVPAEQARARDRLRQESWASKAREFERVALAPAARPEAVPC